ncbi:MAG: peptidoglycan D,D-transpeptidase FtsI family protein [Alphaproteobacteria bacterium]
MIKNKPFLFDSDSLKNFHKRIFLSILIFLFFFFSVFYRISFISISSYFDVTSQIKLAKKEIRGNIYDRNGIVLAATINSKSLSARPNLINNVDVLSKQLFEILDIDEEIIKNKLSSNKKFVWLKRNITPFEQQKIIDLGEINLEFHNEKKRIYPFKNTASHLVGFVNIDQIGQRGIERYFNKSLSNSKDITLSIDINLQQSITNNLLETINYYKAESGLAIVLDISNGEVLSSVSYPDFNPNNNQSFNEINLINRVIQSNYEMGSTFKPLTVVNGYDYGIINPNMVFDVKESVKGVQDHDNYKDNGLYDVEKIVVESSNIGAAQIALKIGKNNQKEFLNKLGFFKKLDIELYEAEEPIGNPNNWKEHETTRIGFGHSFSVTPLHLVKAYASLANDGYTVSPTFTLNPKKNSDQNILLKKESSDYFLSLLNAVITKTKFTGPRVKIDGYNIGGKTGTSELLNPKGGYYKDRNRTSFIGIFPINNPRYVVYTAIKYPKKPTDSNQRMTGAVVNAPLVKKIIFEMIKILNLPSYRHDNLIKAEIKQIYKYGYAFL